MRWLLGFFLCAPMAAEAGTLYLCKSYAGGTFWASGHCQHYGALIERIVPVPDGLPFAQQVSLGEQAKARGAQLAAQPLQAVPQQVGQQAQPGNRSACQSLQDQIRQIDSEARQLQSAASQDRLANDKRQAISMRGRLGCR